MLLLGSFGDDSLYVSFSIERGTWRLACVVMIDVVVELEMLVIADVLLLFRVFVFRIHHHYNHTNFHNPERINITNTPRDDDDDDDDTLGMGAASWLLRRWQSVRIIQHRARHMAFGVCGDDRCCG